MMRVATWLLTSILVGVNLLALYALGASLFGPVKTAVQRRTWAIRCAVAAVGVFALSAVMCGASVAGSFSLDAVPPSDRARSLAAGISDAMNNLAFGVVGSALPFVAVAVLLVLARRAAPPS